MIKLKRAKKARKANMMAETSSEEERPQKVTRLTNRGIESLLNNFAAMREQTN